MKSKIYLSVAILTIFSLSINAQIKMKSAGNIEVGYPSRISTMSIKTINSSNPALFIDGVSKDIAYEYKLSIEQYIFVCKKISCYNIFALFAR